MKYIYIFFVVILLSCKPTQIVKDIQYIKDTVYTKGEVIEKTFYHNSKDTVYIKGEKLTMKYYYHSDSTIYLKGECKAESIYIEKPIIVEKTIVAPQEKVKSYKSNYYLLLAGLILVVLIFLYIKIVK